MKTVIKLRKAEVTITHSDKEIVDITGDTILTRMVEDSFKDPIKILLTKTNNKIISTVLITLHPGDDDYIKAVLLDRIQPELGVPVIGE